MWGEPFYARPVMISEAGLVLAERDKVWNDLFDYYVVRVGYKGILNIQSKSRLAIGKGMGHRFWALEGEDRGESSLLKNIIDTATGEQP